MSSSVLTGSYPYGASVFNNRRSLVEHPVARLSRKSVNMHRFQVLWNVSKRAHACSHMVIITYFFVSPRSPAYGTKLALHEMPRGAFLANQEQEAAPENLLAILEKNVVFSVCLHVTSEPAGSIYRLASRKFIKISKNVI